MKKFFLSCVAALALAGCAETPKVDYTPIGVVNGCQIVAEGYQAAYQVKENQQPWYWTRILAIVWNYDTTGGPNAHAIAVIQWRDEDGNQWLWAYDQIFGSRRIGNTDLKDDPAEIAEIWGGGRPFVKAYFLD